MRIVDLNLLLYAVNVDTPQHELARSFWEECIQGDERIGLAWSVLLGFLRISTRPGLFPRPLTSPQALQKIDGWLALPSVMLAVPGDRHWALLKSLVLKAGTAGNLTMDAHLAALALEHEATLYSADNDFLRFRPDLRFKNPLGA